ncbi:ABC transporter substrate-binding protein [Nakamurella leprariae]|uniref:ABC transporter substrate-binding protein n=1 Tax=Nakamurella leprariae TaxID=2803911 RepID=A0A938YE70_9ACTN|nr:ABC transporter substrate-binding protein [Nakamurella leprariae]MBM9468199.1 ABC transporter substrate-binding protein [Nakamurella leprariae]
MTTRRPARLGALLAAGLATALALTACGSSEDPLASTSSSTPSSSTAGSTAGSTDESTGSVVIGSANFPESALIANIYAEALRAKGVEVTTNLNIGNREVYIRALQDGSIDLIPEYSGTLLQYFDQAATAVSSEDVYTALEGALPDTLTVLEQSAAEDKDSITVTRATAEQYDLTTIADLAPVAGQLVLGGPPEFQTRPTGVPGLESKYGVVFGEFRALDTAGPLTLNALISDQVQAANLFTTDPAIKTNDLVSLEDPEFLFAAQNVLPLITESKVTPAIEEALNGVSEKLTTEVLIDLLTQVTVDQQDSAEVATTWVDEQGLGS